MELQVYAVRDRSAEFYFPPFFLRSQVEAIRAFERLMSDPQRSGAPSEYDLVLFGSFVDQTGVFTMETQPRVIANGRDYGPNSGASNG